jgi:hypothetical protein
MMGVWGTKGRPKPLLVAYEMVGMEVLMVEGVQRAVTLIVERPEAVGTAT